MSTETMHHFPQAASSQHVYDEIDFQRAVQAYIFFYPTISVHGIMTAVERDFGVKPNEGGVIYLCQPHHLMFTANQDTPYGLVVFDLDKTGPTVIDVPPGSFMGLFMDQNFRWVMDVGIPGPNKGQGGKHLLVPPDYTGELPAGGYQIGRSQTNRVIFALRTIPEKNNLESAFALAQELRIYPLSSQENATPFSFLRVTEKPSPHINPLEWEDNIGFWEQLNAIIQRETVVEAFRPMYGMVASLGIEKGKPFRPDQRMKSILDRAAKAGLKYMATQAFADRTDESIIKVYPDRQWEWLYLGDDPDFEYATFLNLEARSRWFYQATGASPAMVVKSFGAGSLYWLGHRDSGGSYLNGSNTYKLSVPANVPAHLFWSITVYNIEHRSMIWTDQNQAALRSLFEDFKQNQDGTIDLYFGPQAPAGYEGQWIKTEPAKGWFAYWRMYGPTQEAFDGSWKLNDFERIE